MKWLTRLLALFIVLPAVELVLLLQFHRWTGFWPTVGIILGTGVLGGYLAKREGLGAWQRLKTRLDRAELPGRELLDGVIILVAGALLVTPGILTDVLGFIGLIPVTRAGVRRLLEKRVAKMQRNGSVLFSVYSGGTEVPLTDDGWQGAPRATPTNTGTRPGVSGATPSAPPDLDRRA